MRVARRVLSSGALADGKLREGGKHADETFGSGDFLLGVIWRIVPGRAESIGRGKTRTLEAERVDSA